MTPAQFGGAVVRRLHTVSTALSGEGWPRLSPWWIGTLTAFLTSGKRQLVARVGRRGGKSSSGVQTAVAFALVCVSLGLVPPNDTGWVVFISARQTEALQRLRAIEAALRVLGVDFEPADGDGIRIRGTNVGFRVLVASVASASGWTALLVIADEAAKWLSVETGQNPAAEVLASARAMMATQPHARMLLLSSPLSTSDAHAQAFDAGDTDAQMVAYAPTWEANPSVLESDTRRLEPDPRVWSREYLAVPQASALACFEQEAVERAFTSRLTSNHRVVGRALIIDASSGKKDTWAYGVCERIEQDGLTFIGFASVEGIAGRFFDQDAGERVVERIAKHGKDHGCTTVYGDQRESLMLASAFSRHGLRFKECPWTAQSKPEAVARVRRWLADGSLILPPHPKLKAELLSFEERVTNSGSFTFGARGNGHDDYVALLLTAALADLSGGFRPARSTGGNAAWPSIAHRPMSGADLGGFAPSAASFAGVANQDGKPDPAWFEAIRQISNERKH